MVTIFGLLVTMNARWLGLVCLFVVGACAGKPKTEELAVVPPDRKATLSESMGSAAGSMVSQTRGGFTDAALSPLEDFNLRRDAIPPVLIGIENPYDLPTDLTCLDLARLVTELDAALGDDWDSAQPDARLRTEQLADSASAAALDAIAGEARGLIPFRDVVRTLTGAETHEKKYNLAFKIGAQRRAYLKGYGQSKGCDAPARPNAETIAHKATEFRGDTLNGQPAPSAQPQSIWSRAMPWQRGREKTETAAPQ
jgi:hypothetical protein